MANEVIYLSSDDENMSKKSDHITIKQSSSQNSSIKENNEKKRKLSSTSVNSSATSESSEKSVKKRVCLQSQPFEKKSHSINSNSELLLNNAQPSTSGLQTVEKKTSPGLEVQQPLLVIKEKHPVNILNGNEDLFAAFIGQIFQRDRSDDMVKIVEKLKRRYEQLDPVYAKSVAFADLLNEKREILLNQNSVLFRHIAEVNEEMKKRKLGKCKYNDFNSRPAITVHDNESDANENESEKEVFDEYREMDQRRKEKIKAIEKCMEVVQKRINKLEATEVDFDDEMDSTFMKTEKYKKRMVELYSLWCRYTNNDETANRSYLRPKHFNKLTGIVTVDQAINSFINSKLEKRRKKQTKNNSEIFPDYIDILNVVHKHNVQNNLGMDKRAEREAAKSAFTKLGEYLQRVRREDLFDSFSTFYENDEDPVKKDSELARKFLENRTIGEKKMNAIFDEYTKKQEELKEKRNDQKNHHGNSESDNDDGDKNSEDEDDDDDDNDDDDDDDDDDNDDERDVSDAELMDISDDELETDKVAVVNDSEKQANSLSKTEDKSEESIVDKPDEKKNHDSKKKDDNNDDGDRNKNEEPVPTINHMENERDIVSTKNSESNTETENQVNKVHEESGDSNEAINEQPILKLRSFAKPPTYWQNSQDGESNIKKSEQSSSNGPIEVIDIDDSDEPPTNKSTNKQQVNAKGPRIVKIIQKKVRVKPFQKKAIIIKNTTDPKAIVPTQHVRILPLNKTRNLNVTILKPNITVIGATSKSNSSIVQSPAVSTTVNRVINPMARENSNSQQLVNILGVVYHVNNKIVNK
ncbi:glutamic acid-rich protein [Chelonus insularis]|uniref:glutamic acid-rich protein n=1 Tax=Chelonus insularis TaxID=460826 RepID=UPI00158B3AE6|nr:glutamic acid-rich protein [Chelonus insularis]